MHPFDLDAYLARVGLTNVPVTASGLRDLQMAQLRTIPFESLDPFLGVIPNLTPEAIFDKLVHQRRGGYCFELNALLNGALTALGFETTQRLGRVRRLSPLGGPRSHLVIEVSVQGDAWLVDTGFGGPTSLVPLRLSQNTPQETPNGPYRLSHDAITDEQVLSRMEGSEWVDLYAFDTAFVGPWDIAGANYLCAQWNVMPFRDNFLIAGYGGTTAIRAFGRDLSIVQGNTTQKHQILTRADMIQVIERLGLSLSKDKLDAIWDRLKRTPQTNNTG